eukprot:scaffold24847_cov58-Phaeocystis_antarctica.AAC.3
MTRKSSNRFLAMGATAMPRRRRSSCQSLARSALAKTACESRHDTADSPAGRANGCELEGTRRPPERVWRGRSPRSAAAPRGQDDAERLQPEGRPADEQADGIAPGGAAAAHAARGARQRPRLPDAPSGACEEGADARAGRRRRAQGDGQAAGGKAQQRARARAPRRRRPQHRGACGARAAADRAAAGGAGADAASEARERTAAGRVLGDARGAGGARRDRPAAASGGAGAR